jgi:sugar lactone lactonase YvrE
MRTIAGTGSSGFSGDGGRATDAVLRVPSGIAVDGAGNIYVSDTFNHRIRRIDRNGVITTVVGDGNGRFGGDGGSGTSASLSYPLALAFDRLGNLLIADLGNSRVRQFSVSGIVSTVAGGFIGDGRQGLISTFSFPVDILRDRNGLILVADRDNHRIRSIDPASGIVDTIAGSGATGPSR